MLPLERMRRSLPGGAVAVAIEVHLAHAMAPENLQPPFPRLFDEPARAVDPGLAPRLELGVIGHGGIRGEAQRADVPPKGVDLAARLVGVGEPVWEPRLEIDAQRVVGVVLDHDPAPAIHRPAMLVGKLDRRLAALRRRRMAAGEHPQRRCRGLLEELAAIQSPNGYRTVPVRSRHRWRSPNVGYTDC